MIVYRFEEFEGPLDLLVHLVRKRKLDIRKVPISVIADEFMDYVERMRSLDIDLNASFMATASYLMELKSKAMIPSLSKSEREKLEMERKKLAEMVETYEKVKEIVEDLNDRKVGFRTKIRVRPFLRLDLKKIEDLIRGVVRSVKVKDRVYRIRMESLGIEDAMNRILETLPSDLIELLSMARNRYEIAVYLIALLELLRLGKVVYEGGKVLERESSG